MYRKILVPFDGSEPSARAVEIAADLAKTHNAELLALHVLDPDDESPDWLRFSEVNALGYTLPLGALTSVEESGETETLSTERARAMRDARQVANRILQNAQKLAADRKVLTIRTILEEGKPEDCILATAKNESVDLIVMGNRGFSDIKSLLSGSVSSHVAKNSACPCLAVT